MKVHSVKSNAKRAARKLCETFSGIDPVEPVAANDGAGWFPAVAVAPGVLRDAISPEVAEQAIVVAAGVITSNDPEDDADVPAFLRKEQAQGKSESETVPSADDSESAEFSLAMDSLTVAEKEPSSAQAPAVTADDVRELANAPAVQSTKEEIAARRAARMQRVADEKANPPPAKESSKGKIMREALDMMRRPGGANAEEMMQKFGWVSHTLRGFVSRQNSNYNRGIETVRGKTRSEPTIYRIK